MLKSRKKHFAHIVIFICVAGWSSFSSALFIEEYVSYCLSANNPDRSLSSLDAVSEWIDRADADDIIGGFDLLAQGFFAAENQQQSVCMLELLSRSNALWILSNSELETQLVDDAYQLYLTLRDENDIVIVDEAIMRHHGLFRPWASMDIASQAELADHMQAFLLLIERFPNSSYAARASLLLAQSPLYYFFSTTEARDEYLRESLRLYDEVISSNVFYTSRDGWKLRNDAIFQRLMVELILGDEQSAERDAQLLANWPTEGYWVDGGLYGGFEGTNRTYDVPSDYVDYLLIYRFVAGLRRHDPVLDYYQTNQIGEYILNELLPSLADIETVNDRINLIVSGFDGFEQRIFGVLFGYSETMSNGRLISDRIYDWLQTVDVQVEADEFQVVERGGRYSIRLIPERTESEAELIVGAFEDATIPGLDGMSPRVWRPTVVY